MPSLASGSIRLTVAPAILKRGKLTATVFTSASFSQPASFSAVSAFSTSLTPSSASGRMSTMDQSPPLYGISSTWAALVPLPPVRTYFSPVVWCIIFACTVCPFLTRNSWSCVAAFLNGDCHTPLK